MACKLHQAWQSPLGFVKRLCFALWRIHNLGLLGSERFAWIKKYLLLHRNIFYSFYFFLNWHHFDLLLWNYLFIVLFYILHCIIVRCGHLSRNLFKESPFLILNYLPLYWNTLHILPFLKFGDFLLVWHICYSTFT